MAAVAAVAAAVVVAELVIGIALRAAISTLLRERRAANAVRRAITRVYRLIANNTVAVAAVAAVCDTRAADTVIIRPLNLEIGIVQTVVI